MQFLNKAIITVTLLISLVSFSQAETTWITKKKDKSKKVEKVVKNEAASTWIKKKKKENKKKFKEKKKESKTWISKKSKKEKKIEKKILKKYLEIANLPKANFYFTAKSENGQVVYGYVDSDKESDLMDLGGLSYFTKSNGYAYLDDGKTTCTVNSQLYSRNDRLKGDVVVVCKNKLEFSGDFTQYSEIGVGSGITNEGDVINFKFSQMKEKNLAFYKSYTEDTIRGHASPDVGGTAIPELNLVGKYYALLIGNSKYNDPQWAKLESPVNDVREIDRLLKKNYNFENVTTLYNATRDEMFDAFEELSRIATDKDYILIYYSGHGDTKSNQAYWVPKDGPKKWSPKDWVNIRDISVIVENIDAQHLVLMVDSCYTGSAFKGAKKLEEKKNINLARLAPKLLGSRTRYVLSSGGNEPVIDTGSGKYSLFAKSFINSLNEKSFFSIGQISNKIALALYGLDQRPYFYSPEAWDHGGGDFLFIPKK